jgi:hypothetical protein
MRRRLTNLLIWLSCHNSRRRRHKGPTDRLNHAGMASYRPFEWASLGRRTFIGGNILSMRFSSAEVKTPIRKICASSLAVKWGSMDWRILLTRSCFGSVLQAGVMTRRIRAFEKPVGYQMILAGFPLGNASLTNLLIRFVLEDSQRGKSVAEY